MKNVFQMDYKVHTIAWLQTFLYTITYFDSTDLREDMVV